MTRQKPGSIRELVSLTTDGTLHKPREDHNQSGSVGTDAYPTHTLAGISQAQARPRAPVNMLERQPGTAPADFDIFCFGVFEVYHWGQYINLPRNQKTAVVLRYLVLQQGPKYPARS